jgi:hypothetical protein
MCRTDRRAVTSTVPPGEGQAQQKSSTSGFKSLNALRTHSISYQASAEHFQQCAKFLPLRNRGLGPLAVTVLTSAIEGEAEILCSI